MIESLKAILQSYITLLIFQLMIGLNCRMLITGSLTLDPFIYKYNLNIHIVLMNNYVWWSWQYGVSKLHLAHVYSDNKPVNGYK